MISEAREEINHLLFLRKRPVLAVFLRPIKACDL